MTRFVSIGIALLVVASGAAFLPIASPAGDVSPTAVGPPIPPTIAPHALAFFVENAGQLARDDVRFYYAGLGPRIGFAPGAVHVAWTVPSPDSRPTLRGVGGRDGGVATWQLLTITFPGARPVEPVPAGELPARSNFLLGSDPAAWRVGVRTYREVAYPGLYEGVDLVYRITERGVKYDFLVAAGADVRGIRMAYEGADGLSVEHGRELVVRTAGGEWRDGDLAAYQGDASVPCRFALVADREVGFECAGRDARRPLVIDPLLYATYLGGRLGGFPQDQALGLAVDGLGNAYVTGMTASANFPTTSGAAATTSGGVEDAFVAKVNPGGTALVYATFVGGSGDDNANGIAVDAAGSAYIVGQTRSLDFPVTGGAFATRGEGIDAFATKIAPSGASLAYSTFLTGTGWDVANDVAVDGSGAAVVTGYTDSPDFPTTAGAMNTTLNGMMDAFVVKLNPAGSALVFGTFLGGAQDDRGHAVALRGASEIVVTGSTRSTDFPTSPGAFSRFLVLGSEDVFVARIDGAGSSLLSGTYLGGIGQDVGLDLALDAAANAVLVGFTASGDFPTTPGAYSRTLSGLVNAFVAGVTPAAGLAWSTFFGGTSFDLGYSLALDSGWNVTIAGYTAGNLPTTAITFDNTYGGSGDGFVATLNATGGSLLYGTYVGGSGVDYGFAVARDGSGAVFLAGQTASADFPTTAGALDRTLGGPVDGYLVKIAPSGTSLAYGTFLGGDVGANGQDVGSAVAADAQGNAYVAGHTDAVDFPRTSGAYQLARLGANDAFVAKVSPDGTGLVYSTLLGGSLAEGIEAIVVDGAGRAYLGGSTSSADFPTTALANDTTYGGRGDAFLAILGPGGNALVYATYLGGTETDGIMGLAVDATGRVYAAGYTFSGDFPTTPGVIGPARNGRSDAFLVQVDPQSRALVYATYLGGSDEEWYSGRIAIDGLGNAYVAGSTSSPDFPVTAGAANTTFAGSGDAFLVKVNPTATAILYGTFLGGGGWEYLRAIAVDRTTGDVYLGGTTESVDFPATPGAHRTSLGGSADGFVAKLRADGTAWAYATLVGGSDYDDLYDIALEGGTLYAVGETDSADFPTTPDAISRTLGGCCDAFFLALNPAGSALTYATYFGGASFDVAYGLAFDPLSRVAYFVGETWSPNFPATPGAFDRTFGPEVDAFLVKFAFPDTSPPQITNVRAQPDPVELGGATTIYATVTDNRGVASVSVEVWDPSGAVLGTFPMGLFGSEYIRVVNPAAVGNHTFRVTATDADGNAGTADGTFVVKDTVLPVADAGRDRTVRAGTSVTFDGTNSTDNDAVASYTWTFTDDGPRTLSGPTPSYTFLREGTVVVTLTVADPSGNEGTDTVRITVLPAPETPASSDLLLFLGILLAIAAVVAVLAVLAARRRRREPPPRKPRTREGVPPPPPDDEG